MTTESTTTYKVLDDSDKRPLFLYMRGAVHGSDEPTILGIYISPELALQLAEAIVADLEERDRVTG